MFYSISFRTHHYLCRQEVALASTRQLRSQGPVSAHAHHIEGVTESEGREGANWVEVGIGIGGGDEDGNGVGGGNGDVNVKGGGSGAGEGTGTGCRRTKERKMGTWPGRGGNGDGDRGGDPWMNTGWERGRERGRKQEQ